MKFKLLIASVIVFVCACELLAQTLAFPTAEGFGAYASGGRGGKVVEVTTLEDDNTNPPEGSLRWALQQYPGEPITVVFRVSGIIDLKAQLRCKRDNYTIAGQTAPGDGICIKGNKVNFGGSTNFIIRHLRFRIGIMLKADGTPDASGNGSIGIENASNFIVDHCTFGWSGEENMTVYDNHYTTVQWCIIHEGLYVSGHNKGARSYASQWGGSPATYHHNLIAHNVSRTPRINGASNTLGDRNVLLDYVNNVNYNWGGSLGCYGGEREVYGATHECNFVNNYYKQGPATSNGWTNFIRVERNRSGKTSVGPSLWYFDGNKMVDASGSTISKVTDDNWLGINNNSGYELEELKSSEAFLIEEKYKVRSIQSADKAFLSILTHAGAFPRDEIDLRIVEETQLGTASGKGTVETYLKSNVETKNPFYNQQKGIIDDPDAVGGYPNYNTYDVLIDTDKDGMPDTWETANGLNPNDPEDRNKLTKSGYTALEVYLNSLVGETIELEFETSIDEVIDNTALEIAINGNRLRIFSNTAVTGVKIYNMLGKQVLSENVDVDFIDVSALSTGVYIVEATTVNGFRKALKFNKN